MQGLIVYNTDEQLKFMRSIHHFIHLYELIILFIHIIVVSLHSCMVMHMGHSCCCACFYTYYYSSLQLLTLGACTRITVIILCVYLSICRVCVSVTTLTATYLFFRRNSDVIRLSVQFSMYALRGFRWKRFSVQKFWVHLLITSAFFASWPAFGGQQR